MAMLEASFNPAFNHVFKGKDRNTRASCEIYSKLNSGPLTSFWCFYCELRIPPKLGVN